MLNKGYFASDKYMNLGESGAESYGLNFCSSTKIMYSMWSKNDLQ